MGNILLTIDWDFFIPIKESWCGSYLENSRYINRKFNIKYINLEDVTSKPHISTIHICRSGAWTPPWLDGKFKNFVEQIDLDYRIINCPKRTWNVKNLNLASIIDCIYC